VPDVSPPSKSNYYVNHVFKNSVRDLLL